jgi:hypothetical protein
MSIVSDYRVEAIWCRAMAAKEANPKVKKTMLLLARQYEEMAEQRDQFASSRGKAPPDYPTLSQSEVTSAKSR